MALELIVYPPNHFGGRVAGPPEGAALALSRLGRMTLNVYVDAFNLYYGCLMGTPYKWLNSACLMRAVVSGRSNQGYSLFHCSHKAESARS